MRRTLVSAITVAVLVGCAPLAAAEEPVAELGVVGTEVFERDDDILHDVALLADEETDVNLAIASVGDQADQPTMVEITETEGPGRLDIKPEDDGTITVSASEPGEYRGVFTFSSEEGSSELPFGALFGQDTEATEADEAWAEWLDQDPKDIRKDILEWTEEVKKLDAAAADLHKQADALEKKSNKEQAPKNKRRRQEAKQQGEQTLRTKSTNQAQPVMGANTGADTGSTTAGTQQATTSGTAQPQGTNSAGGDGAASQGGQTSSNGSAGGSSSSGISPSPASAASGSTDTVQASEEETEEAPEEVPEEGAEEAPAGQSSSSPLGNTPYAAPQQASVNQSDRFAEGLILGAGIVALLIGLLKFAVAFGESRGMQRAAEGAGMPSQKR
ncbi:hypothetical protein [Corynebacterium cystitidis]|uniref:hypothetical protein n=1 Tax=Corynebacterium cystitidis TaxID=35757 RepID=UPI00211EFB88|nr:hypothetical protein [Corynebacterium cystitidis]